MGAPLLPLIVIVSLSQLYASSRTGEGSNGSPKPFIRSVHGQTERHRRVIRCPARANSCRDHREGPSCVGTERRPDAMRKAQQARALGGWREHFLLRLLAAVRTTARTAARSLLPGPSLESGRTRCCYLTSGTFRPECNRSLRRTSIAAWPNSRASSSASIRTE
jgi:hypothetical protein